MPLYSISCIAFFCCRFPTDPRTASKSFMKTNIWVGEDDSGWRGWGGCLLIFHEYCWGLWKCINNNLLFKKKIICFVINWSFLIYVRITLLIICTTVRERQEKPWKNVKLIWIKGTSEKRKSTGANEYLKIYAKVNEVF